MQKEKSVYQKQDYNHRDGERGVALFAHSLQTTENLFKMAFFLQWKMISTWTFSQNILRLFKPEQTLTLCCTHSSLLLSLVLRERWWWWRRRRRRRRRDVLCFEELHYIMCLKILFVVPISLVVCISFSLRLGSRKVKRLEDANAFFAVIFSHILTPLFKSCWCCLDLLSLICSRDPYLFPRLLKCCLMHVNSLWREASPSMALFAPFSFGEDEEERSKSSTWVLFRPSLKQQQPPITLRITRQGNILHEQTDDGRRSRNKSDRSLTIILMQVLQLFPCVSKTDRVVSKVQRVSHEEDKSGDADKDSYFHPLIVLTLQFHDWICEKTKDSLLFRFSHAKVCDASGIQFMPSPKFAL